MRVEGASANSAVSQNVGKETAESTKPESATVLRVIEKVAPPEAQMFNNEEEQLQNAVDQANSALEGVDRNFQYEVHKATKQVIISVIDNETQEVIGEFPARKLLDAVAKLWDLAGLFIDEKA